MPIPLQPFSFDVPLLHAISRNHSIFLDYILLAIALISEFGLVWLLIGLVLENIVKGKGLLLKIILSLISSAIINEILKIIFFRERPYLSLPAIHHLGPNWTNSSFASGHTISSAAALYIIWCHFPSLRCLLLVLFMLIVWSRLYLGMHYPSDIIVGAIIGVFVGSMTLLLPLNKIFQKVWLSSKPKS